MRLHHLEIQAFGPFAGHVVVDLDRLSDAGLFLLSGPTGAGKTSVLDAVCFALYGDVPGDRGVAKRLRCDQAAPGVAPTVTLEATLAGRRFRIVRSPAWERPKKRGSGTTTQQASVTISERVDGAWTPLSSRLDETGHLVTHLVGMNLAQFTQVAMLPQGRFQAFLRAKSEERHQLLQRLFRTGRFEDVERWLRDRRVTLRRRSEACHQTVADLVSRVSEATDAGLPEAWDIRDLTGPAADGALAAWAARLCAEAAATRDEADRAAAAAAAAEAAAHARLDAARGLLDRRARLDAASEEHQRLLAETEPGGHRAAHARRRTTSGDRDPRAPDGHRGDRHPRPRRAGRRRRHRHGRGLPRPAARRPGHPGPRGQRRHRHGGRGARRAAAPGPARGRRGRGRHRRGASGRPRRACHRCPCGAGRPARADHHPACRAVRRRGSWRGAAVGPGPARRSRRPGGRRRRGRRPDHRARGCADRLAGGQGDRAGQARAAARPPPGADRGHGRRDRRRARRRRLLSRLRLGRPSPQGQPGTRGPRRRRREGRPEGPRRRQGGRARARPQGP